ncbi:MAG TPA: SIR2 family protein [Xanthobacteraceae bacterium]|jgi:hypothetical protein|nr:SIR2 family protein [Xanthobacteraceae bacterium]
MSRYLLIGAGFSRNWGGPLSDEISGSLLGDLHDDPELAAALRRGPFEDAFQGFQVPTDSGPIGDRLRRFQTAVTTVFMRLNRTFLNKEFEFKNDLQFSMKRFLAQFDAIFTLNQDLLLEIHYMQTFIGQGKWTGVMLPGMTPSPPRPTAGPVDITTWTWRPSSDVQFGGPGFQPLYKLHGSSNWISETGEPLLIMGNAKTGAIERFPVLRSYHEQFAARLNEGGARLMVIGYGFLDEHINSVIESASRVRGLGTYLVDPRGRDALLDPRTERAIIRAKRDIEDIRLIGELRRPLSTVFAGDAFAHGELMRFFG